MDNYVTTDKQIVKALCPIFCILNVTPVYTQLNVYSGRILIANLIHFGHYHFMCNLHSITVLNKLRSDTLST